MNVYTFKSLGMLGQMYNGGEEVEANGMDFYRVEDVARERSEYASRLEAALADCESHRLRGDAHLAMHTELGRRLDASQTMLDSAQSIAFKRGEQVADLQSRLQALLNPDDTTRLKIIKGPLTWWSEWGVGSVEERGEQLNEIIGLLRGDVERLNTVGEPK